MPPEIGSEKRNGRKVSEWELMLSENIAHFGADNDIAHLPSIQILTGQIKILCVGQLLFFVLHIRAKILQGLSANLAVPIIDQPRRAMPARPGWSNEEELKQC